MVKSEFKNEMRNLVSNGNSITILQICRSKVAYWGKFTALSVWRLSFFSCVWLFCDPMDCSPPVWLVLATSAIWEAQIDSFRKHELKIDWPHSLKGFPGDSLVKWLSAMWETWVQSLNQEDPLAKEMAIHASTLAWKIPWMEEPTRLHSMGSQSQTRLSNFTSLHLYTKSQPLFFFLELYRVCSYLHC